MRGEISAEAKTADQIASATGADAEDVYHCLTHIANNGGASQTLGTTPATDSFAQ